MSRDHQKQQKQPEKLLLARAMESSVPELLIGCQLPLPKRRDGASVSRQTLTTLIPQSPIPIYFFLDIIRGKEQPQTMCSLTNLAYTWGSETHRSQRQIGISFSESKGIPSDIKVFLLEQILLFLFIAQDPMLQAVHSTLCHCVVVRFYQSWDGAPVHSMCLNALAILLKLWGGKKKC